MKVSIIEIVKKINEIFNKFMINFVYMNQATIIINITRVTNELMIFPSVVVVPYKVLLVVVEAKQETHF